MQHRTAQGALIHPDSPGFAPAPHDLHLVLAAIRNHFTLFLAIAVCSVAGAALWVRLTEPQYTATSRLAIGARHRAPAVSTEVLGDIDPDAPVLDTQVELLRSRAVLERAVDLLIAEGAFDRSRADPARQAFLIDTLARGVNVQRLGVSSTLELSVTAHEPLFAAAAANAIAAAFLGFQMELKERVTRESAEWLQERTLAAERDARAAAATLETFRSHSNLLTVHGATAAEAAVDSSEQTLQAATQRLMDARTQWQAMQQALRSGDVIGAAALVATPAMQDLRSRQAELAGRQAQLAVTLGPQHPDVLAMTQQLASLTAQMEDEAKRTLEQLRGEAAIAAAQVATLEADADRARTQLGKDTAASAQLANLQARAEPIRRTHEALLKRLQQLSAGAAAARINVSIVSTARTPAQPSSPNTRWVLAVAIALGLSAATLTVFLLHVFATTPTELDELERATGLPVLASVPAGRRRNLRGLRGRASIEAPPEECAEAFRRLRAEVLASADESRCVIVQFTSSTLAEGKTHSALAFAQTAATDGRRVLLIDADTRRATLTRLLGISTANGLMEVIEGRSYLQEALLQQDSAGRLYVLPLSKYEAAPQDLLASRTFAAVLEHLRSMFELIVIDSAPVLAIAESAVLASRVDRVLLVARWGRTPLRLIATAVESIERSGGRIAGMVVTQMKPRLRRHVSSRVQPAFTFQ